MQLNDVGAIMAVIRVVQEDATTGETGDIIFEYELPLNVNLEKLTGRFTALSLSTVAGINGPRDQFVGLYFNKSVADCSMFIMKVTEVVESLEADEMRI